RAFKPSVPPNAWSSGPHYGRVDTVAEFESLAGVSLIPTSSRNTVRHRPNRGGDRALNSALHMVAVTKMRHDEETRAPTSKNDAMNIKLIEQSDGAETISGTANLPTLQQRYGT